MAQNVPIHTGTGARRTRDKAAQERPSTAIGARSGSSPSRPRHSPMAAPQAAPRAGSICRTLRIRKAHVRHIPTDIPTIRKAPAERHSPAASSRGSRSRRRSSRSVAAAVRPMQNTHRAHSRMGRAMRYADCTRSSSAAARPGRKNRRGKNFVSKKAMLPEKIRMAAASCRRPA